MKNKIFTLVAVLGLFAWSQANAQQKWTDIDKSPMDVVYFPTSLPLQTTFRGSKDTPLVKIYYSRPQLNGREMMGGKDIPYGKVWRLGANEATEITLYKDASIGGETVKAGTYSVYAIPTETEWTIILNTKLDTWGNYAHDESKDVAKFNVKVEAPDEKIEAFSMALLAKGDGAEWVIGWENALVKVPMKM